MAMMTGLTRKQAKKLDDTGTQGTDRFPKRFGIRYQLLSRICLLSDTPARLSVFMTER